MTKKINLKYIILQISILLLLSIPAKSQITNYSENEISDYIQSLIGGEREVSLTSGRADLVHLDHAYEVEWANKWKESIGQSLWYALQLNKKPGIILLMRSKKDYKYLIQLNSALQYAKLSNTIEVRIFPNDFQHLIDKTNKKGKNH